MFKILVCGSREIKDKEFVFNKLDYLTSNKNLNNIEIVQGGQKSFDKNLEVYFGADYFAKLWAKERSVKFKEFLAPWEGLEGMPKSKLTKKKDGSHYWKGAGMYRNKQMLDYKPDVCVGFLSKTAANKGTKNMLKLVKDAGIPLKYYYI